MYLALHKYGHAIALDIIFFAVAFFGNMNVLEFFRRTVFSEGRFSLFT